MAEATGGEAGDDTLLRAMLEEEDTSESEDYTPPGRCGRRSPAAVLVGPAGVALSGVPRAGAYGDTTTMGVAMEE